MHAARCGERAIAADAYLGLALGAQATQSYLEAEAGFGSALELLPPAGDARVITAARGRGLMRFRLGRHEDALGDLRHARREARDDAERTLQILLDESTVLDWLRDFVQSAALTELAASLAEGCSQLTSARLAMSMARVHHRRGESEACVRIGSEAASRALSLGDDGYETRVSALLMVAPDCVNLGLLREAELHFDAVIAEAEAHGDRHHLGAAHVNRALLWFAQRDAARLFEDLARGAQIARELGEPLIEYPARINMGEVAYALEQLDRASEHTQRAMALARQLWGDDNRELGMCELLLARIALHEGELERVGELTASMHRRMADARAKGSSECEFLPPEQALLEMVELAACAAGDSEWDALELRCRSVDMQPQEQVAILECRALAALRSGRREHSKQIFERALALSASAPNLLSERVTRRYAALFA
jgi:tetratricopeptide (TPR) repeat protein